MNLETKITIYKFTPQLFTLTLFSDYVDDPELISALQCYIHTILRISLHKHYNICGLWGVSMALGRFNKRAAFTTFFRNFRLFS